MVRHAIRRVDRAPGVKSCGLGQTMSGVIVAMRRTLLSCTSLARNGLIVLAAPRLAADRAGRGRAICRCWMRSRPSRPQSPGIRGADHGAGAARLFGGGGDPADAHPRLRAARNEARLRADIGQLQVQADRFRALLFAEPQILISWAAGDNRPQITGDISLLMPQDPSTIRRSASSPSEPGCRRSRRCRWIMRSTRLREAGEGFLLNLTTSNGHSIEAMGRAIGGQAIVRIRELGGCAGNSPKPISATRRWWRKPRCCAISPPPRRGRSGPRARQGRASLRQCRLCPGDRGRPASRTRSTATSNCSTATSRDEMERALDRPSAFTARLPIVVGGERRIYDVQRAEGRRRQRRHRDRRQRSRRAQRGAGADGGGASPHARPVVLRGCRVRRPAAACLLQRFLSPAVGPRPRPFSTTIPTIPACSTGCAPRASCRSSRISGPGRPSCTRPIARSSPTKDTWYLPDGRALSVVTTPNPEGGVTYLFDDVTESLDLARRFDGLIRVQRETLDSLAEAVAVFGSNGRAQLFNPAFARMWKLSPEALREQPHIDTVEAWCRPLFDDAGTWRTIREAVTAIENRIDVPLKLERKDGSVLDCMTRPLPDGATMLTFQDITDTENVERALRESNEALEAADQMKIDFVHHVSYELRSPLTTIIGFAHFLSDPVHRPADAETGRVSRLRHQIDQRAARAHQQHPRPRHHRRRRDEAGTRPGRYRQGHRGRRRRHPGPPRHRPHPPQGRRRSRHRKLRRRRTPRGAGAV